MAKRRKKLPARTPRDESREDHSLLLRSAESLGRVIGALQKQLDDATRRLSRTPIASGDTAKTRGKAKRTSKAKKTTRSAARKPTAAKNARRR